MDNSKTLGALLRIKECDLRADTLRQFAGAVDKGGHVGGAFSALAPLTALYYGNILQYDVENPTATGQDVFLLSKGHAVAALATVFADVGYFPKDELLASRGWGDLIKGHPGPVIPGVPVATGPLGHGISIACGFAHQGKEKHSHDVYVLTGDGELQEGSNWEGLMFAGDRRLNNLCVIVDKNNGQSDDTQQLLISPEHLAEQLYAFGFQVLEADGSDLDSILSCLQEFRAYPRAARPTAIIVDSIKGFGGYGALTGKHKGNFTPADIASELSLLMLTRQDRIHALNRCDRSALLAAADTMGYDLIIEDDVITGVTQRPVAVQVRPARPRDNALRYNPDALPALDPAKAYGASDIMGMAMKAFAADPRLYTIDSDLSNVSGLFAGTAATNRAHAINPGIAEAHMMNMAEGLAVLGNHVWVSTFGVFFDWQVFRRIAVSYQERLEVIESGGWLAEGHNLDITFYSTAANLDTAVNGATHMDNDDINFFLQLAHVKVIDTSCPQQLLAVSRWIAEGDKGLVYLRVMRNAAPVLYPADYRFAYGEAVMLRRAKNAKAVVITSGHGVAEALTAAEALAKEGIAVSVLDMASYDSKTLQELAASGVHMLFAEQNNGAWFDMFSRDLLRNHFPCDIAKVHQLSAKNADGSLRFIQSGTYEQIVDALGLSATHIADLIRWL